MLNLKAEAARGIFGHRRDTSDDADSDAYALYIRPPIMAYFLRMQARARPLMNDKITITPI